MMISIRHLIFVEVLLLIFLFTFNGNSQYVFQDSLLKTLGVDEVIYTKDVYYDKDYRYTAPVIFGFDSLSSDGLKLKSVRYIGNNRMTYNNIYDNHGRIIEKVAFKNTTGNLLFAREFEYDEEGRLAKEYEFDRNEIHEKTTTYHYAPKGNLIKIEQDYMLDDFHSEDKYYYNRGLVADIVLYQNDIERSTLRHKYDQFDNLLQKYIYRKEKKYAIVEFEYDERNRLIKKSFLSKRKDFGPFEMVHRMKYGPEDIVEFVYEYLENGLVKSKTQRKNRIAMAKLNFSYIYYE